GPGTYNVRVRVTDDGTPNLSDTKAFSITVNEVNTPPVLSPIANQSIGEGSTLSLTVAATDPDIPSNNLTFSFVSAPFGASINAASGLLTWTPTETQGPSTNVFAVRVTEDGVPSLNATQSFTVVVSEVNSPPQLAPIQDKVVGEGNTLTLTIT